MSFDDLPMIRFKPTPSDAELAAERDIKHQAALDDYYRRHAEEWPVGEVIG